MKKVFLFLGILFLSLTLTGIVNAANWSIEIVDSYPDPDDLTGLYASIALDSNDYPHIGYQDNKMMMQKYAYKDVSGWHIELPGNNGFMTSIDLNGNDKPHLTHWDLGGDYNLGYVYKNGGAWQSEIIDPDMGIFFGCSIKLDNNDIPNVSYYDYDFTGTSTIKYASRNGGWTVKIVDSGVGTSPGYDGAPQSITFTSLAMDNNNYPHMVYNAYEGPDTHIDDGSPKYSIAKYAYKDGSGWHVEEIERWAAEFCGPGELEEVKNRFASIALDSNDYPHIIYYSASNTVKYAYKDGSGWHIETIDTTDKENRINSIAIDQNDNPHVVYADSNSDLKYAYKDGSWTYDTVDVKTPGTEDFSWLSIALDSSDTPHIAFQKTTEIDGGGDLRYATPIIDTTAPSTPSVTDDGDYTSSSTELHATWTSADSQSGIVDNQYCISTNATDCATGQVVDWTSTGSDQEVTKSGLTLNNNTTYYFHIKTQNGAGTWSSLGHSDGITVDTGTPTAPGTPTDQGDYSSSTSLTWNWTAATNGESGIAKYYISIGTTPGGTDVVNDLDIGNVLTYTKDGLSDDTTYYAKVKAEDGIGQVGPYSGNSDGIKIDTTEPTISLLSVNDNSLIESDVGTGAFVVTIDFSETMTTSTAPTIEFDPAVTTTLTNCAGSWSDSDTYTYTCDIADADIEQADVDIDVSAAKDAAGNTMNADTTSGVDKFDIDTIAPTNVGTSTPADGATEVPTSTALVALTARDANSGLAAAPYYFELATDSDFTKNLQDSDWDADGSWNPTLLPNTTYYWRVKAKDAAGNESSFCGHTPDSAGYSTFTTFKPQISLTKSVKIGSPASVLGAAVSSFFAFPNWLLLAVLVFFIILIILFSKKNKKKKKSPPKGIFKLPRDTNLPKGKTSGKTFTFTILFTLAFITCLSAVSSRYVHAFSHLFKANFEDEGKTVHPGDTLTYRIEYENTSDTSAEDVIMIDSIPSGSSYISSSLTINGDSKTDALDSDEADFNQSNSRATTFNLGTVPKNTSGYVTFQIKVNDPKEKEAIENQGQANFNPGEFTVFSNTVSNPVEEEEVPKDEEDEDVPKDEDEEDEETPKEEEEVETPPEEEEEEVSPEEEEAPEEETPSEEEVPEEEPREITPREEAEEEVIPPVEEKPKEKVEISDFLFNIEADLGDLEISSELDKLRIIKGKPLAISIPADRFIKPVKEIIIILGSQSFSLELNKETGKYEAIIPSPFQKGEYSLVINIIYEDGTKETISTELLVDPYGYVYEKRKIEGEFKEIRIPKVEITLFYFNSSENNWQKWEGTKFNQENPKITDQTGEYAFMVPEGRYYLEVIKQGYQTKKTDEFQVKEEIINKNIEIKALVPFWQRFWWLWGVLEILIVLGVWFFMRRRKTIKVS